MLQVQLPCRPHVEEGHWSAVFAPLLRPGLKSLGYGGYGYVNVLTGNVDMGDHAA